MIPIIHVLHNFKLICNFLSLTEKLIWEVKIFLYKNG